MRLSIKRNDITPDKPCFQGGYTQRKEPYHDVHDPITITAFGITFENTKIVIAGIDVVGFDETITSRIMDKIHEANINLDEDHIILNVAHTHSGPLVSGDRLNHTVDTDYQDKFVQVVSKTVIEAYLDEGEEVTVKYRKTLIDGLYSNRNDKNKMSDKWIHSLGFYHDDNLVAMLVNLAHHCTILGPNNMDLSADLFGELRKRLESQEKATVMMIQGNAGDMGNKQYRKGNLFDELESQASNIIDQMNKRSSAWIPLTLNTCNINTGSYHAEWDDDASVFEAKKKDFEEKLKTETNFDTVKLLVTGIACYSKKIEAGSGHRVREMKYRIFNIDDIQLVVVPGELGSILGLRIKEASNAKICLVFGYAAPTYLGYMVEKEAYGSFSQESNVTDYPSGISDAYVEEIIHHL